jgi:hypothetical protein
VYLRAAFYVPVSIQRFVTDSFDFADDVESLVYCAYFLSQGSLPWFGVSAFDQTNLLLRVSLLKSLLESPPLWLQQSPSEVFEILRIASDIDPDKIQIHC